MIEEAHAINFERVPDGAWQIVHSAHGEMRVSTAGMLITLLDEDGNGMSFSLTRDAFTALLLGGVMVKCDG